MPGGHENEETQYFERQLTSICKKFAFFFNSKELGLEQNLLRCDLSRGHSQVCPNNENLRHDKFLDEYM